MRKLQYARKRYRNFYIENESSEEEKNRKRDYA